MLVGIAVATPRRPFAICSASGNFMYRFKIVIISTQYASRFPGSTSRQLAAAHPYRGPTQAQYLAGRCRFDHGKTAILKVFNEDGCAPTWCGRSATSTSKDAEADQRPGFSESLRSPFLLGRWLERVSKSGRARAWLLPETRVFPSRVPKHCLMQSCKSRTRQKWFTASQASARLPVFACSRRSHHCPSFGAK